MRLIDADKVEQAIKDYWKAQVDKALTLTDGNEKRINIYLEHNHELLKAIDELPSAQPERLKGEWIQKPRYEDDEYPDAQPNLKCPFCGYEIGWCDMGNYCARCGADLKGGAV